MVSVGVTGPLPAPGFLAMGINLGRYLKRWSLNHMGDRPAGDANPFSSTGAVVGV